jgi:hypothetical protein
MHRLTLAFDTVDTTESCVLCGKRPLQRSGLRLAVATGGSACRECGQRWAPKLVALVDLACTAQRVGHISRHTVVPPLETLLDLARLAENYVSTPEPATRQRAA